MPMKRQVTVDVEITEPRELAGLHTMLGHFNDPESPVSGVSVSAIAPHIYYLWGRPAGVLLCTVNIAEMFNELAAAWPLEEEESSVNPSTDEGANQSESDG